MQTFGTIPSDKLVEVEQNWVGPNAPAGTPDAGDMWWDTDDPPPTMPGQELAYNQITTSVTVTQTAEAAPQLVIEGTSRTYDGSPVIIDCYLPSVYLSNATQFVFNMWDAGTDLGRVAGYIAALGNMSHLNTRRRLTPTAGTHNFRLVAWIPVGTSVALSVGSGAGAYHPGFIRVTRV